MSALARALALIVPAALLAAAACAGGAGSGSGSGSGRVQVVTTLPILADLVRNVGGDRVEVTALLPPGSDPHTYDPSPRDVERVEEADIAIANGMGLEPSALRVIEANLRSGVPLVKLGERARDATRAKAPALNSDDPHLWLDPYYAKLYVGYIADELSRVDPEGEAGYHANHGAYYAQVDEVERYVRQKVESIPPERRKLVTAHDAFERLADAFGLQVIGFAVRAPGQEPSPEDRAELTRKIGEQAVPAVFVEPQIDAEGRILEESAGDAGVIVCSLYSDSLDDNVKSYLDLMRFNGDQLATCLGEET